MCGGRASRLCSTNVQQQEQQQTGIGCTGVASWRRLHTAAVEEFWMCGMMLAVIAAPRAGRQLVNVAIPLTRNSSQFCRFIRCNRWHLCILLLAYLFFN